MARPVLGAVFVVVCGSITVSGMKLIQSAKNTTANTLLVGTTLLFAIGTPVYVKSNLSEWVETLPSFLKLLTTNTVVIAVIFGILLNIILNYIFGGKSDEVQE